MLWLRQALSNTALQAGRCKESEESIRLGQPRLDAGTHKDMPAGYLSGPLIPNLGRRTPPPRNLPLWDLKGWGIVDEVPRSVLVATPVEGDLRPIQGSSKAVS